jgi:hypothetical protein
MFRSLTRLEGVDNDADRALELRRCIRSEDWAGQDTSVRIGFRRRHTGRFDELPDVNGWC